MAARNKHHIWKKRDPKPWNMGFPGDSSISSRKIITMKMRQNLGHFGMKRVKGLHGFRRLKKRVFLAIFF